MRIILTSDLHYEYSKRASKLVRDMFDRMAAEPDIDLIAVAGDWASHSRRHLGLCTLMLRKRTKLPIVGVLGNHDYWCSSPFEEEQYSLEDRVAMNHAILVNRRIVSEFVSEREKVVVVGWDGWYGSLRPPSNDSIRSPSTKSGKTLHEYLSEVSNTSLDSWLRFLNDPRFDGWKKVVVTHFNLTPCDYHSYCDQRISSGMSGDFSALEKLLEAGVTTVLYGHTHARQDEVVDGVRLVNAGADYVHPRYVVVEI